MQEKFYLELFLQKLRMAILYDDLDEQLEWFLKSTEDNIENAVRQNNAKTKIVHHLAFLLRLTELSGKKHATKCKNKNRTRLQKNSRKTSFTLNAAKSKHFSKAFSTSKNKRKNFYKMPNKMTSRWSMKTNPKNRNDIKNTMNSSTVIPDMFEKNVDFSTTVEGPSTPEWKNDCF